jgi:hypothetical protein
MMDLMILVAATDLDLQALAATSQCTILHKTGFDTLGSTVDPAYGDIGAIDAQRGGWVALAKRD